MGDYYGSAVNRSARLRGIGHGGQVLVSSATAELVRDLSPPVPLKDMGKHELKDLAEPEHVYQLLVPGLPADFPPLRSLEAAAHNIPAQPTSFIGREAEIEEICGLLAETPCVTLTGIGGTGKTRLGLEVGRESLDTYSVTACGSLTCLRLPTSLWSTGMWRRSWGLKRNSSMTPLKIRTCCCCWTTASIC